MAVKKTVAASPEAETATEEPRIVRVEPIIYRRRKKKRKYTKGTKDFQKVGLATTKASERVAKAVRKGLTRFNDRSRKSRDKRRDGAVRDALTNAAAGFGVFAGDAGWAPYDLARKVPTRRLLRRLRPRW